MPGCPRPPSGRLFARLTTALTATAAACLLVSLAACDKPASTPSWLLAPENPPASATTPATAATPARRAPTTPPATIAPSATPTSGQLRFVAYNVENWLLTDRMVGGKTRKQADKPESEKKAVIELLLRHRPDVLGLCEVGGDGDLQAIQGALKVAGLDLPYRHGSGGSDPERHLGILSRYPLRLPTAPPALEYPMKGKTFVMSRGILDATIDFPGNSYRFLGVHLKSKREVEGLDESEMRFHEARLLRNHVDGILKQDPQAKLVVYGDFNDTRPSRSFRVVTGSYKDPGYLTAIPLRDARGETWTHYWQLHDIYSRFDFVAVSASLKAEVDFPASRIIDDPQWIEASDHRPLLILFK